MADVIAPPDVEEIRRRIENLAERMEQSFTAARGNEWDRDPDYVQQLAREWVAAFRNEARSKFTAPMVWE
jgi:hypothetical protein